MNEREQDPEQMSKSDNHSHELVDRLAQVETGHQKLLSEVDNLKKSPSKKRDHWDKISALTPLISGVLISGIGLYFTHTNNLAQVKIQEVQTIEKLMPHLAGSEAEKKLAIVAIKTLTNTTLATKIAELVPSKGTVDALQSIAHTGNKNDKVLAKKALVSSLTSMANSSTNDAEMEGHLKLAQDYQEQIDVEPESRVDVCIALGDLAMRKNALDTALTQYLRAKKIMQESNLVESRVYGKTLGAIARVYRQTGNSAMASDFQSRADKLFLELGKDDSSSDITAGTVRADNDTQSEDSAISASSSQSENTQDSTDSEAGQQDSPSPVSDLDAGNSTKSGVVSSSDPDKGSNAGNSNL